MPKILKSNQKNWEIILKLPTLPKDYKINEKDVGYIILAEWNSNDIGHHFKGYVQFKAKKRQTAVMKYFACLSISEAHPPEDLTNKEYTDKFKKSHYLEQGTRIVHARVARSIHARAILENIIRDHKQQVDIKTMMDRYPLNARDIVGPLSSMRHTTRTHKPNVLYLYGPTGIGKTVNLERAVKLSNMSCYDKPPKMKWWQRYDQQAIVIMEEFSSCIALETFLKICDGTPLMVESKGNLVEFNSPYIIMTSNRAPEDQYPKEKYTRDMYGNVTGEKSEQWKAYYRRITQYVTNPVVELRENQDDPESRVTRKGYDRWEWESDPEVMEDIHQRIFRDVVDFLTLPVEEFVPPEDAHSPKDERAIEQMQENAAKVMKMRSQKPIQIQLLDLEDVPYQDLEDDNSDNESQTDTDQ